MEAAMRLLFAMVLVLVALLIAPSVFLVRPALAETTRCMTYEEKTLGRLQILCTDGMRGTSYWNKTLERWESIITSPPGKTCMGPMHPKTRQGEGRCR
jgi:hypothetical protein